MKSACAFLFLLLATPAPAQQIVPAFAEPSISPDGREIAFVSGGDIWTVPSSGGEARLLVSDPAMEARPLYSPDGKQLAFVSMRTGNGDIYVVDLAGGATRRITYDDFRDQLDGWSRDGRWLYFTSNSRDIGGMQDVWRVAASGGTPMQVTAERYVSEYFSAPSPDGSSIAFAARGISANQWWRHGSSNIDMSQIWLAGLGSRRYTPLTTDGSREIWPMWMPDGKRLYFVSDRGGAENLWSVAPGSSPQKVTSFTGGRLLWPSISYDGRSIVFERDFGIWRFDTASGNASEVRIALRGVPSEQPVDHRRITDRFSDFALSPDGKKVAFVARGDVFAASSTEAGDALRITNTAGVESQPTWSPDSRKLVYVSDRNGRTQLFQYDVGSEKETQLTDGEADDTPRFSPDGKSLAFQRNGNELAVMDVATKTIRTMAKAILDRPPLGADRPFDWSPDSKWLAFLGYGEHRFRNAFVVPAAGGGPRQVSFLANVFTDYITWSADGRFLLMATSQRAETGQIARIDLVPTTPKFREDQFRDLFAPEPEKKEPASKPDEKKEEPKKEAKPVEIVFAGIRDRVRFLPTGLDASTVEVSRDGKWIAFVATVGANDNVYVFSIDELATDPAVPKQLSTSSSPKADVRFSPDGKEVYYRDGGKIAAATIDPVKSRTLSVAAEMDVELAREKQTAFAQTFRWLRDNFYDPAMHGVDWAATRDRFAPRIAAARSTDELRRLLNLMVGELNASHTGALTPTSEQRTTTGRIGVRFDRNEYETSGRLKVSEVLPLSAADVAKIKSGDVIVAVDGKPVVNFDQALEHTIDKRTVITLDGTPRRDVVVRPTRATDERALTYRAWVNASRDYVEKISGGRLGYVHMFDMSWDSLQRLHLDLDAENRSREGVVIDIRNNNGGFVNVYAIDVFSRKHYLNMAVRGAPPAAARTVLGQRSLEKPTILVTNRHSLSDAEDFTEGYRALGLGKVVGEPTAGWIIFTSNIPLVDGTLLRIPFVKITDANGVNMERNPRPVDVQVQRAIGESYEGKDTQLDAAVKELLALLP